MNTEDFENGSVIQEKKHHQVVPEIQALLAANCFKSISFPDLKFGCLQCFKLESTTFPHKTFTLLLVVTAYYIAAFVLEEIRVIEDTMKPFKTVQEMVDFLGLSISPEKLHHIRHCYAQDDHELPVTKDMYPSCLCIDPTGDDRPYNIYFEYSNRRTKSLYRFMKQCGHEEYYEAFQSAHINSIDSLYWIRSRRNICSEIYQFLRNEMMVKNGLSDSWIVFNPFRIFKRVEVPTKWKGLSVTLTTPSEIVETNLQCGCSSTLKVVKVVDVEARKIYYNKTENTKGIRIHEASKVTNLLLRECTKCSLLRRTDLEDIAIAVNSTSAAVPVQLHVTPCTVEEIYLRAKQSASLQMILPETGSTFLKPDTYRRMILDKRFGQVTYKPPTKNELLSCTNKWKDSW